MRVSSRMKAGLFILGLVVAAVIVGSMKSAVSEYRTVGVSKGIVTIPCAKNGPGTCGGPDPDNIAFYFKAPIEYIGHPPDKEYYHFVGVSLFVSGSGIKSIAESSGGGEGNYIIGSPGMTVRIDYSGEDFLDSHLARLNTFLKGDYGRVKSDIQGYRKYDDRSCPDATVPVLKDMIPENRRWACVELRKAVYVPDQYPGSIVDCAQYLSAKGLMALRTCEVITTLDMGGRARYAIRSKSFLDGSWVGQNKRITQFLNQFLVNPK